jgi:hypothetical protein
LNKQKTQHDTYQTCKGHNSGNQRL